MEQKYFNFVWIFYLCYWLHFAFVNGQSNGDLRLSLGNEGILEIYYNGTWGYVCSDGWDEKDSSVACRNLGFGSVNTYQIRYPHPNETEEFKINHVDCTGYENDLFECSFSTSVNSCNNLKNVYLDCSFDNCQSYLPNTNNSAELVQYFDGEDWFYICKNNFSEKNADVICYENYGTKALSHSYIQNSSLTFGYTFYPFQFKCTGDETSLCRCLIVNQTCESFEAVEIMCKKPNYGAIRLTNNADKYLQTYINSNWIYVCVDIFENEYNDDRNKNYVDYLLPETMDTACRELGFSKAKSYRFRFEFRYSLPGDDLVLGSCSQFDTSISNCTYNTVRRNFCPARISLRCEADTCNTLLAINTTADLNELPQIYSDKFWSYICFDGFTSYDANVICRETTLTNAKSFDYVSTDAVSQQRPISQYNYSCNGNETSICSCSAKKSTCNLNSVVTVSCNKPKLGSIRLSHEYYGYIEVYNGEWRKVCDNNFNSIEAKIICKSAGFRTYNNYDVYSFFYYYDGSQSIRNLNCYGDETNLLECSYSNYTACSDLNFVSCEKDGCETSIINPESLEAVKIYVNQWYSMCEDNFTQQTADIICQENHGSNASRYLYLPHQSSNYPIYPFYFQCEGNEESICACKSIPQVCSSTRIVYIECNRPSNGRLRLSNGTSGELEVYLNGWKRTCSIPMNQAVSNVVCRSLGYREALTFNSIFTGNSIGLNFLTNIRCFGNETNILECSYGSTTSCNYDTYISCETEGCQSYIFDDNIMDQPVMVYKDGNWYNLCFDSISTEEANVICRENGFLNGVESVSYLSRSQLKIINEIYLHNFTCQGYESSLCDCLMIQTQCAEDKVATVKCLQPDQGTLRYSNQYPNILEIYYNGGWNNICSNNWDNIDSNVACRQLGYTSSIRYSNVLMTQSATSYPNNFGNVNCNGTESSIVDCGHSIAQCQSYTMDYGVQLFCTSGDCEVHAPFATRRFQIVEYYNDQARYYLCADGFTRENADVVCRETSNTLSISYRGLSELKLPPNTQIYPLQHSCFGNESSLCNCSTSRQLCPSGSVSEVQCGTPVNGSIRSTSIGYYLEGYSDGWKYVCGSNFNNQDAVVACRQQGFRMYRTRTSISIPNDGRYWGRAFNCRGDETKLVDCPYTLISSCSSRIRLDCETENCGSILINGDQSPSPVRYFDGHSNYYLCKQGFTMVTAKIVCREGGYGGVLSIGATQPNNTGIRYAISNRVYNCSGNELSLCNCSYTIQICEDGNIAEVQCKNTEQYQLRLNLQNELLFYYNNVWIHVCYLRWDTTDSDIACRQLGYRYAISSTRNYGYFSSLDGYVSDVTCFGNETKLSECRYHLASRCISDFAVLLSCHSDGCQSYVSNAASYPQIIRYYSDGWYYLCGEGFTLENADVVCRENVGTTALSYSNVSNSNLTSDLQILDKRFSCTGKERSLCNCYSSTGSCLSNFVVKLQCRSPVYGHIRLSNRDSGVLEIYLNEWGYVCDDGWNRAASEVVCRQLGLERLISFKTGVEVNNLLYPFIINDIECNGNESTIYECTYALRHNCGSGEHVSITCGSEQTTPTTSTTTTTTTTTTPTTSTTTTTPTTSTTTTPTTSTTTTPTTSTTTTPTTATTTTSTTPTLAVDDIIEQLDDIMDDLNKVETISDDKSGQTADMTKVVIDALNDNVDIEGQEKSKILENAATTVQTIVEKTNGTFSNETSEKITDLLSSIVNGSSDILVQESESTESQQDEQSTVATIQPALAKALNTLEEFSKRLSEELANSGVNSVKIVESQFITIVVQNVELESSEDGETKANIVLPMKISDDVEYSVMITLSTNLAASLSNNGQSLAIATSIVKRIENEKSDSSQSTQGSDILIIAIAEKSGIVELKENVILSFDVYSKQPSKSTCVFLNGTNWVSDGLSTDQSTAILTNCESKHLTSFAVFVTPYKNDKPIWESIALSAISYLFVGISFIFLIISLILFLIASKAFFKVEANIIYFNYCLSMLLATGLFVFGIQVGTYNIVLCNIIAFLLHYSWLSVFTWTLCIGILIMYKIVINVLSTKKIYKYLILFGWGFPLIIPVITIAVARDQYVDVSSHCFLNVTGGVIWAFIGPILIMILINAVFLIIALIRIVQTQASAQKNETRNIVKNALITGLVLTPVLGLPWLILIFNVTIQHSVLEWIFIIVNGSMGFVFFLVVVLRNREVLTRFKRNKQTTFSNAHQSSQQTAPSSTTPSSFTSNRFRKINTLEKHLVKESEIQSASIEQSEICKSPYEIMDYQNNIYEINNSEDATPGKADEIMTGYDNPSDVLDDLPVYHNLSNMGMVTEVISNPMYMQSPSAGYTNGLYSTVADVTESDTQAYFNPDKAET